MLDNVIFIIFFEKYIQFRTLLAKESKYAETRIGKNTT